MEDKESHLLLHGFTEASSGNPLALLWDTGSDVSFLSGTPDSSVSQAPQDLIWSGNRYPFSVKKGIIPDEMKGIVGLDFFRETCVWWSGEDLYVFHHSSVFCERPQAYLSTSLKTLVTKRLGAYAAVTFRFLGKQYEYGLLDTGSSFCILPKETDEKFEFLRKETVILAGNRRKEAELFHTEESLGLATNSGVFQEYSDIHLLTGISLENFLLPREKDRGDVWVVGLSILRKRPLFWDFSRNRIAVFSP